MGPKPPFRSREHSPPGLCSPLERAAKSVFVSRPSDFFDERIQSRGNGLRKPNAARRLTELYSVHPGCASELYGRDTLNLV